MSERKEIEWEREMRDIDEERTGERWSENERQDRRERYREKR